MKFRHHRFFIAVLVCIFCLEPSTGSVVRQPGNVTIAVFLPVHTSAETEPKNCSEQLDFKRVVETQAIVYAVNKVNSDPALLDGVTLGYDVEDTCEESPKSLLDIVNKLLKRHQKTKPLVALLLDLPERLTQLIALYKSQDLPLLSLGPVSSRRKENNVFYLEAGQPRLSNALLKLIQKLNWTLLDVLVENEDDYQLFKDSIKTAKICQSNVFHAKQNTSQFSDTQESREPLLVFSDTFEILKQQPSSLFRGREIVFTGDFLDIGKNGSTVDLPRAIAIQRKCAQLKEFQEHLWESVKKNETWLGKVLRESSQFQNCNGSGSDSCISGILDRLSDELRYAGKAIDAVYTVAHSLTQTQSGSLSSEDILGMSEFTSPTGNTISFTANKDLVKVIYDVYSLAKMRTVLVGNVQTFPKNSDTIAELVLDKLEWNSDKSGHPNSSCLTTCPKGVTPVPSPGRFSKCCVTCPNATVCGKGLRLSKDGTQCIVVRLDYLRWRHPLSLIIMILVAVFFCVLVCLVNLYVKKAHTPTILTSKLATMPLLLSLFITLIVPLLPILKPSTTACNAYTFGFIQGLGIPLCILISRSHSLYKRFRTEEGSLKKKLCHSDPQNIIAVVLILIQLVLSVIFLAVLPAHVIHYETDEPDVDYIECSIFSRGEFLFPFFYTVLLTIIFSVKNFSAVTQEEDIYESHFVALSIFGYYFLSLITLIVIYGVHGKVKVMFVCIIAFLHLLNFLVFIFFPKIYVIVFKRDPSRFSPFPLTPRYEVELLISDKEEQSSV